MHRLTRHDNNAGQGYPPQMYVGPGGQMSGVQMQNGGGLGGMGQGHQQMDQQHQQQQQQQQQQQGMQMGGGQGGGPSTASDGQSNAAAPAPEMNLANVLHYLQSEWRRWERDRNEWEIERAEMRARIALLEGQRRSAENFKVDLLRRVKMLEFALRQERSKSSTGMSRPTSTVPAVPPSRLIAIQDVDRASNRDSDKEGSGSSEGGDDISDRPTKLNGDASARVKAAVAGSATRPTPDTSAWKNLTGPPRDPKARARSREYLKQCLQEITYLTSPGALNPLPSRAPVSVDETGSNPDHQTSERPRKALPEQPIPSTFPPPQSKEEPPATNVSSSLPNGHEESRVATGPTPASTAPSSEPAPPSSPAPRTAPLPAEEATSAKEQPRPVVTAIYRPESKAAWREELRAASEAASQVPWPPRKASDEEQLAGLTLVDDEVKPEEFESGSDLWTTRRALKSHLDVVRGVAFGNGTDLVFATGGDDCTVKVWRLDAGEVMSSKPHAEIEPISTLRGHTAGVTAVLISTALNTVFSASMDTTIRLWRLPARDHDPYAPYDPSTSIQTLEGHTDVVWDIALLPPRVERNGGGTGPNFKRLGAESQLVSVSADGTAKVWEDRGNRWNLVNTFSDFESGVVPTCVTVDSHDFGRIIIGLSNGLAKVYNVDTGVELQSYGEPGSQVNAVISHPTLPLIVTGHEDGYLRFYDTKSPTSTPNLLAHPAPITSLALSPLSPMCILSASVDCSVRLWDLQRKTSLQDLSGHRQRSDEGVTHVSSHPELPIVASAGADGVVRLWGAG